MTLSTSKSSKSSSLFSIQFWIISSIILVLLVSFGLIADSVSEEDPLPIDPYVFQKVSVLNSPLFTKAMLIVTFFGSKDFLLPAYIVLVLYFFFVKKDVVLAITIGLIRIISKFLILGSKSIFRRIRPVDPLSDPAGGFSFPSGHAISSFTFFGLLIYLVWRSAIRLIWKIILSIILFITATTIAFSRVYLRFHFASDVIGGICLSMILLFSILGIMHMVKRRNLAIKF